MEKLGKRVGKSLPFKVPSGYFEDLNQKILQTVGEKYEIDFSRSRKISGFKVYLGRILPYISMAAIVTFVVVMMQLFIVGDDNNSIDGAVADIGAYQFDGELDVTDEEIIEYLSRSVDDVESFLASMQ